MVFWLDSITESEIYISQRISQTGLNASIYTGSKNKWEGMGGMDNPLNAGLLCGANIANSLWFGRQSFPFLSVL